MIAYDRINGQKFIKNSEWNIFGNYLNKRKEFSLKNIEYDIFKKLYF